MEKLRPRVISVSNRDETMWMVSSAGRLKDVRTHYSERGVDVGRLSGPIVKDGTVCRRVVLTKEGKRIGCVEFTYGA